MYEYILRTDGHGDEVLVTDHPRGWVGELVTMRNRLWKVQAIEAPRSADAIECRILVAADDRRR